MIAFSVFFFEKVHFELFELFQSNFILVSQVGDKAHKKFDFFEWHGQLALRDYILVNVRIDLNDFCLLVFARREIVSLLVVLTNSKEGVLVNVVAEFGLLWLYHCQM